MKKYLTIALMLAAFVGLSDDTSNDNIEIGYSENTITNRAWRRSTVGVNEAGQLVDISGNLVGMADAAYLEGVSSNLCLITAAGCEGFHDAKTNFQAFVNANTPTNATIVSAWLPVLTYGVERPEDANFSGYIFSETRTTATNEVTWNFSQVLTMEPHVMCQDVYLTANGVVATNYQDCTWVDFSGDLHSSTNGVANPTNCLLRMVAPAPAYGLSDAHIINHRHLAVGLPERGFSPGAMLLGVREPGEGENGALYKDTHYGVTGTYTDTVHHVIFKIESGAFKNIMSY